MPHILKIATYIHTYLPTSLASFSYCLTYFEEADSFMLVSVLLDSNILLVWRICKVIYLTLCPQNWSLVLPQPLNHSFLMHCKRYTDKKLKESAVEWYSQTTYKQLNLNAHNSHHKTDKLHLRKSLWWDKYNHFTIIWFSSKHEWWQCTAQMNIISSQLPMCVYCNNSPPQRLSKSLLLPKPSKTACCMPSQKSFLMSQPWETISEEWFLLHSLLWLPLKQGLASVRKQE